VGPSGSLDIVMKRNFPTPARNYIKMSINCTQINYLKNKILLTLFSSGFSYMHGA